MLCEFLEDEHIGKNQIIKLVVGDTLNLHLFINQNTKVNPVRYNIEQNDTVYFRVMKYWHDFGNAVVEKVYTSESDKDEQGNLIVHLESEDTEDLLPGTYFYCIKLVHTENDEDIVDTIMPNTFFYLMP